MAAASASLGRLWWLFANGVASPLMRRLWWLFAGLVTTTAGGTAPHHGRATDHQPHSDDLACLAAGERPNLHAARALSAPSATQRVGGEFEGAEFWEEHAALLGRAWAEYPKAHPPLFSPQSPGFSMRYIGRKYALAVAAAREDPSSAATNLARLREEVLPGVWGLDGLLSPTFCDEMLAELDNLNAAGIPMRRPNGMNRYGAILADVGFEHTFNALSEHLLIPLALSTFPELARRDDLSEQYAFVVRYKQGEDLNLALHADASVVTFNLCLGRRASDERHTGTGFTGGELAFEKYIQWPEPPPKPRADKNGPPRGQIAFEPGMLVMHRGQHKHEALPLISGERVNLVVWLFAEGGTVRVAPYPAEEQHTVEEVWAMPKTLIG